MFVWKLLYVELGSPILGSIGSPLGIGSTLSGLEPPVGFEHRKNYVLYDRNKRFETNIKE